VGYADRFPDKVVHPSFIDREAERVAVFIPDVFPEVPLFPESENIVQYEGVFFRYTVGIQDAFVD
jgi:hypothetical protein